MSKGNKLEFKQTLEFKEAVSYLEALLESFKSGTIVVQKGAEAITLTPSETIEIEIKARDKKDKGKFSMEISWKEPEVQSDQLIISSTENMDCKDHFQEENNASDD
ncbi:amphi-Trp domain-containing protein [Maridesulfovibrio bastinii]|uniref:amphi-Trp domain-containing protein n=1 Tax=Maridesulfovibrio bastinii TaxID=47157 RepID=UPI000400272C|nr:amphi-Trp domain-containing protein [Maridesulfovibrio bastinii]